MAKFCLECGSRLMPFQEGGTERLRCERCGWVYYLNPVPASAVVVAKGEEVLLVKRAVEPRSGYWSLPSGFVEYNESPLEAAVREAKEETGIDVELTGLLNVVFVNEFPEKHCVLIIYSGRPVRGDVTNDDLRADDDVDDARFFPFNALPDELAFRSHGEAIKQFLRKQRGERER
ncbi:MAG: NUDIX hydrolase [Planctomycetota bacterium]|nr:MAG: NUDIX hydrolase [Planctomycetota bacterium]